MVIAITDNLLHVHTFDIVEATWLLRSSAVSVEKGQMQGQELNCTSYTGVQGVVEIHR